MTTPTKEGIIYKTVDNISIPLDIYLPPNAQNVPILLWFHGGGLLQGHRNKVLPHMLASVAKYNHALVTADYRLAPQVDVQEIYQDVRDCIAFIRNELTSHLEASTIDPSRLAVSGSSAGGYLTLLAGLYVEPKPQVILPIYPITDPLGTFFTTPQPWPLEDRGKIDPSRKVSDETVQPFLERTAAASVNTAASSDRNLMYNYMLDRANLASLLHLNVDDDPQHDPANDLWRVSRQIAERGLPPAYVVHGTVDRDVGVEQADEVVGVMVGEGLRVEYERVKGVDHVFDADPAVRLEGMYAFMHKHV